MSLIFYPIRCCLQLYYNTKYTTVNKNVIQKRTAFSVVLAYFGAGKNTLLISNNPNTIMFQQFEMFRLLYNQNLLLAQI